MPHERQPFALPERRRHPATADLYYTEDEEEFLKAVDAYKRKYKRPFPTMRELFQIMLDMGFTRPPKHLREQGCSSDIRESSGE